MRVNHITVGLFVVVGIALFALGIFLIGSERRVFSKHVELYTKFANVTGVSKGTKVRVAGLDAGEVLEVSVPEYPSTRFRLKMQIDERLHAMVRKDSLVTIATEGVVGDKTVSIRAGSPKAPEAAPYSWLPSKEQFDMTELMDKAAGLLSDAGGTMKVVQGHLTEALDTVKTTVNNVNGLVVDLKHGKGTVGMLLQDETTAKNIQQAVANVQQATVSLNSASKQADALIADFGSRELGQKTDDTITSVRDAARHIDAISQQVHETVNTALAPDDDGVDAGTNIRQSLSSLNQATGNMVEDTEAVKRGFFFKAYFKKRGYYSLTDLSPTTYRKDKFLADRKHPRLWLEASDLFRPKKEGGETLCPAGKAKVDAGMESLGADAVEGPLVVEGYSTADEPGDDIAASRSRARLVRDYLHLRFKVDAQKIGTVGLAGTPPPETHKESWDGVSIVFLKTRSK